MNGTCAERWASDVGGDNAVGVAESAPHGDLRQLREAAEPPGAAAAAATAAAAAGLRR